jgi:antitoxin (DNA-binding transcriptional repressor) of toxin-antitoxin stability system
MRNVNASDARKHWFRLLDEALNGEVIIVQRKGRRLVLRREESAKNRKGSEASRYKNLLRVPNADHADRWTWEWRGSRKGLHARRRRTS